MIEDNGLADCRVDHPVRLIWMVLQILLKIFLQVMSANPVIYKGFRSRL